MEDVCNIQNGYSFLSSKYRSTGNPIIRIGNIQGTQLQVDDLVYFEYGDYKEDLSRFTIKPQDLVITARGSCGKVALNQTDDSFYLNQGVWRLDPNPQILNKEYLFHLLLNLDFSSMVIKGQIPRLNVNQFKKLKISIPPLSVQEDIASKLSKFQELKEELVLRKKQHNYYRRQIWESCISGVVEG